ncbi:HAD-IIIC family phosphatase [Nocardiopsis sp. EMB25]|uniref:HAD-IIIC family phosphatase n=1 Tax=Nocardiopsis sp. EMB25 TaxID=2835867 RepID=UPI002283D967|nr:HAD-IIIC family phosphatase [Nocardiopsis sp. EMB25]MCY9783904.1 HAD-IIIC family phosphatase [Nocardiopsis sp. EMB25]
MTGTGRQGPLARLRALKRQGLGTDPDQVRALIAELTDPLDLEAAGRLVGGAKQRAALTESGAFRETRIAFLASSTIDPLPPMTVAALAREGVVATTRAAGFDQWRLEVLGGAPELGDLEPRVVACLLDDRAVLSAVADPLDLDLVERRCAEFVTELCSWYGACREALGGATVLNTVPLSPLARARHVDYAGRARLASAWHRMNADILALAAEHPSLVVVDTAGLDTPTVAADDRMRHIASHAFSPDFLCAYAEELTRIARADLGLARKCLVLDLDNTLWGGVVGDDGVTGIRLGGAYPGSAHSELQRLVRDLGRQGVMLTVSSKNDRDVAEEALTSHPEMVLSREDLLAVRADWRPKPDNVAELARDLNIGVDAMAFVDDNPAERELMRHALPGVTVPDLPDDPSGYALLVARGAGLDLLRLTREDRDRAQMYRARTGREELRAGSDSLEDYLHALGSDLSLEPLDEANAARVVQLFAKTNQFNLTGRRYTAEDVERITAGGGRFYAARLADRFGDNGLIAALALVPGEDGAWEIGNAVMSCRVFSRKVEHAILGSVLRAARRHGATAVTASFTRTDRNAKFSGLYPELGFATTGTPDEDTRTFHHHLAEPPPLPAWITVTHGEEIIDAL